MATTQERDLRRRAVHRQDPLCLERILLPAKSGYPESDSRSCFFLRLLRSSLPLLLFQFLTDKLPFQRREIIDEQLSIQMIDLVLDAHGEKPIGFQLKSVAISVQCANLDRFGSGYLFKNTGDR